MQRLTTPKRRKTHPQRDGIITCRYVVSMILDCAIPSSDELWGSVVVLLMLAPHPSLIIVLVNYHLRVLHAPGRFFLHLGVTYTLTFLAFSSLIVVVARDPGPVNGPKPQDELVADGEDMNVMQALLATNDDDIHSPGKWCRKCWAPKPERAHQ